MSLTDTADRIRAAVAAAELADQVASVAIRFFIRKRAEAGGLLLDAIHDGTLDSNFLDTAGITGRDARSLIREARRASGARCYHLPQYDPAETAKALYNWRADRAAAA
jgi:hypothetical protein